MAKHKIYTRTYSNSSAGQLVSGKGARGFPLSETALLREFQQHINIWNRVPTALVSASTRIVDSLKRAIDKYLVDDEPPADIWIAFIAVPSKDKTIRIHSAKRLAERFGHPSPYKFSHETVFEWAIPKEFVVHKVSLQTLMRRGLPDHRLASCFLQLTTAKTRMEIARTLLPEFDFPWDIGISLGFIAKTFGARAPVHWIANQLFYDCFSPKIVDDCGDDVVELTNTPDYAKWVDFSFFRELEDGIDQVLVDWWFQDDDFLRGYEVFKENKGLAEDWMN